MTSKDTELQERRLADELCVDALLAESGLMDDAGLRAVLLELRSLRGTEVPVPSAEVAALMGQPVETGVIQMADWAGKRRKNRRVVFTTLTLAASLGVAGGAAAGNDSLRRHAEGTISSIVEVLTPPGAVPPAAELPLDAPGPVPAVVPSPAWTLPPALHSVPPVGAPEPRASGFGRPDAARPENSARIPGPPGQSPQQDAAPAVPAPDRQPGRGPAGSQETPAILPLPANPADGPAGEHAKGKAAGQRQGTAAEK